MFEKIIKWLVFDKSFVFLFKRPMSENRAFMCGHCYKTRMVVHGHLVQPAVCLSDLYDVFQLDIVRETRQTLWTMIYTSP